MKLTVNPEQSTTHDSLIGTVRSVEIEDFVFEKGIRYATALTKNEYTMGGIKRLLIRYDDFSDVKIRQVYEFEDGYMVGYTNYDRFGEVVSFGKYKRNEANLIIAKYHNDSCEEQYYYNESKRISKIFYPATGAYTVYEYDENGFVEAQRDVSENSSFGKLVGPKKMVVIYENDERGNIMIANVLDDDVEPRKLLTIKKYFYDNNENEILCYMSQYDGATNKIQHKYEYDEQGNWILKQLLAEEGSIQSEVRRSIEYY